MNGVYITPHSRFRDTLLYATGEGLYQYGPYAPPPEFESLSPADYSSYICGASDVGFPDLIATRFYGPGTESLWWVICRVNGIVDVETDIFVGRKIKIPPYSAVAAFVARV